MSSSPWSSPRSSAEVAELAARSRWCRGAGDERTTRGDHVGSTDGHPSQTTVAPRLALGKQRWAELCKGAASSHAHRWLGEAQPVRRLQAQLVSRPRRLVRGRRLLVDSWRREGTWQLVSAGGVSWYVGSGPPRREPGPQVLLCRVEVDEQQRTTALVVGALLVPR